MKNISTSCVYESEVDTPLNDLVSVLIETGERFFYRVQKLDSANKRIKLRLHTASTINNDIETLPDRDSTVTALLGKNILRHEINAIGIIRND